MTTWIRSCLHRNVNRLFDEVFRGFDTPSVLGRMAPLSGTWPSVEFLETDQEIRVTAEIPGLDENDVEVTLDDGVLTLRGEKKGGDRGQGPPVQRTLLWAF